MKISFVKWAGAPALAAFVLAGCGGSEEETPTTTPMEEAPAVEENTETEETDIIEEDPANDETTTDMDGSMDTTEEGNNEDHEGHEETETGQ